MPKTTPSLPPSKKEPTPSPDNIPKDITISPQPVTTPQPDIDKLINPQPDKEIYLENFMTLTHEVPKYRSIQMHRMITIHLDKELANQLIEYLERTGWKISDISRLMLKSYVYLDKTKLFELFGELQSKNLLSSDNIEDLKYIRDKLKTISPGFIRLTGEEVSNF